MIIKIITWVLWTLGLISCRHKWGKWSNVNVNSEKQGHQNKTCRKCNKMKVRWVN